MQNLVCNNFMCLMLGYFLCVSSLPPDWGVLRQALAMYERKHIQPIIIAQQKRFQAKITPQERKKIASLSLENGLLKTALMAWQKQPTNMADREAILKKLAYLRTELIPIQEKYAKILAAFAQEREVLKPTWKMDMDAIIAIYNAEIAENTAPMFAKHNFGNYDDEDEFLLWQKEAEAAAAGKEE